MCGIVGAVSERDVQGILLEGLRRLEYRGYDSAGMAVISSADQVQRAREVGKVAALADAIAANPVAGHVGIAHTRWATHGEPSKLNAHPHMSGDRLAIVHNGIIENYQELRDELKAEGFEFTSQTDTEVVAHLIAKNYRAGGGLYQAVKTALDRLRGAYALAVVHADEPDHMVVCRQGSPLVIGVGIGENFIASDQLALLPVTDRFMFLEEGDIADIRKGSIEIHDREGMAVERADLGCHGLAQHRHAGHGRVLVQALLHGVRHRVHQTWITVEIREALAQVDRAFLGRQRRHDGEDGGADVGQAALECRCFRIHEEKDRQKVACVLRAPVEPAPPGHWRCSPLGGSGVSRSGGVTHPPASL